MQNGSAKGIEFNFSFWNNKEIKDSTGYQIEDIKNCMYDLSILVMNSFDSDLKDFDLD